MRKQSGKPADCELQIPGVLWRNGPDFHVGTMVSSAYRHAGAEGLDYDDNHNFKLNSWSYETPRFTKPFYNGRAGRQMVLILMFDRGATPVDEIRFSPFKFKLPERARPAWDFQYVIHRVQQHKQYGFRGRLVWKPWVDRDDCRAEYDQWLRSP